MTMTMIRRSAIQTAITGDGASSGDGRAVSSTAAVMLMKEWHDLPALGSGACVFWVVAHGGHQL